MAHVRSTVVLMAAGLAACSGADEGDSGDAPTVDPDVQADLRADSNRDGEVRFDDSDMGKMQWDRSTGAIFLANIDDDDERCKSSSDDLTIATCNDAQDDIVNGDDDALDLARLKTRPLPKVPDDATGRVLIATDGAKTRVRLFKKSGPDPADFEVIRENTVLSSKDLRAGVELGIEATDIVRDPEKWDGYVDIALTITSASKGNSTDRVRLRVAPVLTYHHLLPAEKVWVSKTKAEGNWAMRTDLAKSCKEAGLDAPKLVPQADLWTQDFFEPAYMSMPAPRGAQHVMQVNYRSANVYTPDKAKTPLRPAGQFVFNTLRGKNVAGIQQFDLNHALEMDSLNSFGNLETIPPHEKDGVDYPFGRVLRGKTKSFYPDRSFVRMVEAQGQQPAIDIDTSWLLVGHVDETLSFVKAPTPRGWMLLANDARLAKKMLEDAVASGNGDETMFVGKTWIDYKTGSQKAAEIAIKDVLADQLVMQSSAEAAAEVDAQLEILKRAIGLGDDEIIKVPFLHTTYSGKSVAYQPGTVNGVYLSDTHFGAPDPHGPVIGGKDIFKKALAEPLAEIGITVDWIEDWEEYHVGLGEVHCGTNATRQVPEARWWESGR